MLTNSFIIPAIVLAPIASGICSLLIRSKVVRRVVLVTTSVAHLLLVIASAATSPVLNGWLAIDALGRLFLSIVSVLFLVATVYGIGYLSREKRNSKGGDPVPDTGAILHNSPESLLTGCLLFFLAAMSLVCVSNHLGLLWVAIEATTLASAPMIYFHRRRQSLEAAWKYLLICSIGIALALFGIFLLAVSTSTIRGVEMPLLLDKLLGQAALFHPQWLKPAFVFLMIGYGTKMGLAPLHTWLPDAHSESPSFVSALLSGALLNCAFLGILRAQQIMTAAGLAYFGQELLIGFGLLSMGFAAVYILQQPDFKRMLAYSSVEHMGILALGVGLGGAATFGAMFHAINHSLTKGMLFLIAGNILAVMRTKTASEVRGLSRIMPVSALLWMAGFFAITGSPPFSTFLSEFTILKSAVERGYNVVAVIYALILSLIFIAMASIVIHMVQGTPRENTVPRNVRESWLCVAPPIALCVTIIILGIYMPPALERMLAEAASIVSGVS